MGANNKRPGHRPRIAALALTLSLGACAVVPVPAYETADGTFVDTRVVVDPHAAVHALDIVGHVLEAVFWIHAIRYGGHYHHRHRH